MIQNAEGLGQGLQGSRWLGGTGGTGGTGGPAMPEACQGMPPELVGSGLESVVVFGLELLEGQGLLA